MSKGVNLLFYSTISSSVFHYDCCDTFKACEARRLSKGWNFLVAMCLWALKSHRGFLYYLQAARGWKTVTMYRRARGRRTSHVLLLPLLQTCKRKKMIRHPRSFLYFLWHHLKRCQGVFRGIHICIYLYKSSNRFLRPIQLTQVFSFLSEWLNEWMAWRLNPYDVVHELIPMFHRPPRWLANSCSTLSFSYLC